MDRDKGLRRTTAITGVLVAASLAGTLAVGLAARTAETAETGSSSTTATESSTTTDNNATTPTDSPTITSGSDSAESGQATSGGS